MDHVTLLPAIFAWTVLTAIAMAMAVRWLLPFMSSEKLDKSSEKEEKIQYTDRETIKGTIVLCCLAAAGSALVFFGRGGSLPVVSVIKISLTYAVLGIACLSDIKQRLIPNLCPLILMSGRILLLPWEFITYGTGAVQGIVRSLIVAAGCTIVLTLFRMIGRGGIGFGDIKLLSALAFLCGFRAVLSTLLFATLTCLPASVFLLVRRKKGMRDYVPMGPFILAGFAVTIALGIG